MFQLYHWGTVLYCTVSSQDLVGRNHRAPQLVSSVLIQNQVFTKLNLQIPCTAFWNGTVYSVLVMSVKQQPCNISSEFICRRQRCFPWLALRWPHRACDSHTALRTWPGSRPLNIPRRSTKGGPHCHCTLVLGCVCVYSVSSTVTTFLLCYSNYTVYSMYVFVCSSFLVLYILCCWYIFIHSFCI